MWMRMRVRDRGVTPPTTDKKTAQVPLKIWGYKGCPQKLATNEASIRLVWWVDINHIHGTVTALVLTFITKSWRMDGITATTEMHRDPAKFVKTSSFWNSKDIKRYYVKSSDNHEIPKERPLNTARKKPLWIHYTFWSMYILQVYRSSDSRRRKKDRQAD